MGKKVGKKKYGVNRDDLTPKQKLWLDAYLDRNNSESFLNATRAAMAAGYDCKSVPRFGDMGWKNVKKFKPIINEWLAKGWK